MTAFLYGMWFMWFCLCIVAKPAIDWQVWLVLAVIIPGLLVMVGRGLWFVVRLVKFKWEKHNNA